MCTNQDIPNIPFIMMGNHVLVHGHKKDLPHISCIFHLFKYVVKIFLVSAILHHISMLRLLPKSYFKKSTFQPNFLCTSSFKATHESMTFPKICIRKKAAIPRIGIRIRICVRKILMRTPYSTFQYPLNVSAYFCLHNIVLNYRKIQHHLPKIWLQVNFLFRKYHCIPTFC